MGGFKVLTGVAASVAFALIVGSAQAANFDLTLTSTVASVTYDSFTSGGTHYDQGVFTLSGLDDTDSITVSNGDTIDATITLDQPFTVPGSQQLTSYVLGLTGPGFPSGSTGTSGTTNFYLAGNFVNGGSAGTSTAEQIASSVAFDPPNNGALTFDTVTSDFTITQLSGPATLDNAIFYYTLFSSAVPETSTWAMMLVGFGGLGAVMRSRRKQALTA